MRDQNGVQSQSDLFSPLPLEGIFHKPTPEKAPSSKPLFSLPQDSEAISSSPPWLAPQHQRNPYPQTLQPSPLQKSAFPLEEHEDKKSQNDESGLDISETTMSLPHRKSEQNETDVSESVDGPSDAREDSQAPDDPKSSQHAPKLSQEEDLPSSNGQSSSATGSFSPVYISKHNTVDGKVGYAPVDSSNPNLPPQIRRTHSAQTVPDSDDSNLSHGRDTSFQPPEPRPKSTADIESRNNATAHQPRPQFLEATPNRNFRPSASTSVLLSDSVLPSDSISQVNANQNQQLAVHKEHMSANNATSDARRPGEQSAIKELVEDEKTSAERLKAPFTRSSCNNNEQKDGAATAQNDSSKGTQEEALLKPESCMDGDESAVVAESNLDDSQLLNKREAPVLFKQSTPKRLRTSMHDSQIPEAVMNMVQEQHHSVQAVIGKKRKDARYDNKLSTPDPSTIAKRDILRPRNPTPGQAIRDPRSNDPFSETMPPTSCFSTPANGTTKQYNIGLGPRYAAKARFLASEAATFKANSVEPQEFGSRKQSISTQDYVDEAMKIMDLIRSRKRSGIGLNGEKAELFEALNEDPNEDQNEESEMSPLPVSRPPSRDGPASAWRTPATVRADPRIVSHLRKYEETGDESFLVSSIARSVRNMEDEQPSFLADDDQAMHSTTPRTRRHSDPPIPQIVEEKNQDIVETYQSNDSNNSSNRTATTSSTQRARNVATIMPSQVSHLIGVSQTGMTFDPERNTWVRKRTSKSPVRQANQIASSSVTDEDPLGEIPDLSVNEQEQKTPSHRSISPSRTTHNFPREVTDVEIFQKQTFHSSASSEGDSSEGLLADQGNMFDPEAEENLNEGYPDTHEEGSELLESSVVHASHHIEQDFPKAEMISVSQTAFTSRQPNSSNGKQGEAATPSHFLQKKRRDLSVLFSSPVVSHEWLPRHGASFTDEQSNRPLPDSHQQHQSQNQSKVPKQKGMNDLSVFKKRLRSNGDDAARTGEMPWNRATSISRIDEKYEISFVSGEPDGRRMSLSFNKSTPMPFRQQAGDGINSTQAFNDRRLSNALSPLSDFTVHQNDERHLQSQRLTFLEHATIAAKTQSNQQGNLIAADELVAKLTDAIPGEPYWDRLRSVDLSETNLDDMNALDTFCPHLDELVACRNQLRYLDGAPSTIRQLNVASNYITSLAPWGHLTNLQYLDVSNNQMDSLEGLSGLLHLRELRADYNEIEDLHGLRELDSLLSLSIKGNRIEVAEFETANMKRLERLDLSDNSLESLTGIGCLPFLQYLDLSGNKLSSFPCRDDPVPSNFKLTLLNLACNLISIVQLAPFPMLSALCADSNTVTKIKGIADHECMQALSLRNQKGVPDFSSNLNDFRRVKHLWLSGTSLQPELPMTKPFVDLHSLDISFTGVQSLPSRFGKLAPNLRKLNVNMNGLKDLKPLRGILSLRGLQVRGNRIGRLRSVLRILGDLQSNSGHCLEELDLRDNPVTFGFYPNPRTMTRLHDADGKQLVRADEYQTCAKSVGMGQENWLERRTAQTQQHTAEIDTEEDAIHLERLDEDTRFRRRVYELLLAARCKRLKWVDGMTLDLDRIKRRDDIWAKLMEYKVVEKLECLGLESKDSAGVKQDSSWLKTNENDALGGVLH